MRPIDADALLTIPYVRKVTEFDETGCGISFLAVKIDDIYNFPPLDYTPLKHGKWVLTESPYAEYEEGVDGESHDRWTCSLCGGEAGFDCDPDGFASFQDKTKFCGHCGAKMDGGKEDGNQG